MNDGSEGGRENEPKEIEFEKLEIVGNFFSEMIANPGEVILVQEPFGRP